MLCKLTKISDFKRAKDEKMVLTSWYISTINGDHLPTYVVYRMAFADKKYPLHSIGNCLALSDFNFEAYNVNF